MVRIIARFSQEKRDFYFCKILTRLIELHRCIGRFGGTEARPALIHLKR